ncbi:unnamed protein product [Lampetra fluviatilis]
MLYLLLDEGLPKLSYLSRSGNATVHLAPPDARANPVKTDSIGSGKQPDSAEAHYTHALIGWGRRAPRGVIPHPWRVRIPLRLGEGGGSVHCWAWLLSRHDADAAGGARADDDDGSGSVCVVVRDDPIVRHHSQLVR